MLLKIGSILEDMKMVVKARAFRDVRESVGINFDDPSKAVQASKEECDINNIVRKYLRTGELPGARQAAYADISEMPNLQDALHMVADAQNAFESLPAEVRRYFDNDPVKLVNFAADKGNLAKARELGLVDPPEAPVIDFKVGAAGPAGNGQAAPAVEPPAQPK